MVTKQKEAPKPAAKPVRAIIDWEAVEMQYRAGLRSLKEIGSEFGVSDAGIIKRAKRDGWSRDLKAKIKAKAEAKVSAAMVSAEVSAGRALTEKMVVEANSEAVATVQLAHRKDIGRSRTLAMKLLEELERTCDNPDLLEKLADLLLAPELDESDAAVRRKEKMWEAFNKALSLGGRTSTMKQLADTLKTLVALEREAFGLAEGSKGSGKLEDWLDEL